jgi:hypothetical protein
MKKLFAAAVVTASATFAAPVFAQDMPTFTEEEVATATAAIEELAMCRNIKTLFNFEPPATEEEIRASAQQFVRKLSGFNAPSKANEAAFDRAVDDVADVARTLLASLHTHAPARDREAEAAKARERSRARFA